MNRRKGRSFTRKPFVFFVFVGFFPSNWGGSCKMSLKHPEWPFGSRMMTIGAAGLKYLKMAPKQVIRIAALDRLEICAHTYTRGPYILLSLYICVIYFIFCSIIFTVQRQTLIRFDALKLQIAPSLLTPRKPPSVPRQPAGHGGILIVQPVLMDASSTWGHRKAARPRCGCHCDIQKSSKNPTQD